MQLPSLQGLTLGPRDDPEGQISSASQYETVRPDTSTFPHRCVSANPGGNYDH